MTEAEIARIATELEDLRSEVRNLRMEMAREKAHPGASMRQKGICRCCGGRSFLHVARVRDHNYGDAHTFMAIEHRGILKNKSTGTFELYACRRCELVEWYVTGAGDIDPDTLDRKNRENIRIVDDSLPPSGPLR